MVRVVPGKLPAKVIVAPNSPSARAQASTAPAAIPGPTRGRVTRRKTVTRPGPQRGRGLFEPAVRGPQRALDREHQEGQRDEDLGQHDRVRGEREGETGELVQRPAEQAGPTEHGEQGHPAHHRRQHQRDGDQRPQQRRRPEPRPGQQPGQRYAEQNDDDRRDRRGDQGQPQRLQRRRAAQHRHRRRPRGPGPAGRPAAAATAAGRAAAGTPSRYAAPWVARGSGLGKACFLQDRLALGRAVRSPRTPGPRPGSWTRSAWRSGRC